jgi:hypothetical protein
MFNLHLADIHSSDPVLDDATDKKGDTASIPRENPVDDAIDEKGGTASIPRETPPDDTSDEKGDTTLISPAIGEKVDTSLIPPAIGEKVDTSLIPPATDEKGDTPSIPRIIYPIMAVVGVMTVVLLGCLAVKKQKNKSTKKPRRGAVVLSSLRYVDEDFCASPASDQESHDVVTSTGSLKKASLEDEDEDMERGNSILISDISASCEWEDTNTTTTEDGSQKTPGLTRSLFPTVTVASILNMASIAYLNRVDVKSIHKSPSEKAVPQWPSFDANDSWESHGSESENSTEQGSIGTSGPPRSLFSVGTVATIKKLHIKSIQKFRNEEVAAPWQLFNANDSSSWESHGSVSENNVQNDGMSSSTGSVYIEETGINDSDSDGSSISSQQDWKDAQSMDDTIVWSFSATHIGNSCEIGEI